MAKRSQGSGYYRADKLHQLVAEQVAEKTAIMINDAIEAAVSEEREKAARTCEYFASILEQGGGDHPKGARLRQAARHIRESKWREPTEKESEGR